MEQARLKSPTWPVCLAVRENCLPSDIPHIPLLIEDIPRYVSLPDYKENCVKSVQTIGEIVSGTARKAFLRSISSDHEARVTLNLEELPTDSLYLKDDKERHLFIWEKFSILKIFGMLEQRENEIVLVAHKLIKIQDVYGSLRTLSLLSTVAHPMYYQ
ncbi:hypothetical protein PUN28_009029 [Cardiocondyla obscurior]